jgi:LuxR family maltose regulon positive regulatory protein
MERLQEGLNCSLTLVSAPAGFGKTTLVSEWARQNQPQIPTAWVSLDEGDNDPVRFWDYFIASIQTFQTNFAENIMPWLKSSEPPSTEPLIIALINELANIAGDCVIVLDDYHLIESQQINEGITYLLEHLSAQMHLVIAARADPHLPLAKFRGRGTMLEIGADDLRFTVEDATCLLKELKTPELSADAVAALNQRTEGWAVGLKMAALSMRGQEDISAFIADFTGSQHYVMDYLIEEVLQKQTEQIRDFLLKTSGLERLSAPLCDAVTGLQGSRDILLGLERGHLFIVPLDESRQWYRYEHLFADLLSHQCEVAYGKEEIKTLHQMSSQWYENNSLPDEAIHHALAAQDWESATKLIIEHGKNKRRSGEFITLYNWLQALPEDVVQTDYLLCSMYCNVLTQLGKLNAAESRLKIFEKTVEQDDRLKGEVLAMRADILWRRGGGYYHVDLAREALSLLPPDSLQARASMNFIIGGAHFSRSELRQAEKFLTEGYEIARQAGDDYTAFFDLALLGLIHIRRGKLHRAAEIYRQAIELAEPSPAAAPPHLNLGTILYVWNDLQAATEHTQRVIELSRLTGYPVRLVIAYHQLAMMRLAHGDESGAIEATEQADFEAQKLTALPSIIQHTAYRVNFAIRQDDIAYATELGNKILENKDLLPWYDVGVPALLLLAQGKKKAAAKQYQALYEKAVQTEEQYFMILYRIYQALAAENEESAVEYLSEALTSAESEGHIRTFVDRGKLLATLLEKALSQGVTPEYTRKLITIIEAEERQKLKRKKGEGVSPPYQALLSERELEILRLIAADVSNQQIADSLTISLSTVKTHVHHILEKLNARDRSQAVFYARELELI